MDAAPVLVVDRPARIVLWAELIVMLATLVALGGSRDHMSEEKATRSSDKDQSARI
jgi:hypothetical protein